MRIENAEKILILVSIVYLIFLLYLINVISFESDEGTHLLLGVFYLDVFKYATQHPSLSAIYTYAINYLIHYPKLTIYYPPLFHFILSGFFALFGTSIFIGRLVTVLFVMAFIPILYYFSHKFTKSKVKALLAVALFMTSAPVIYVMRAYTDLPETILFSVSVFFFIQAIETGRTRDFTLATVLSALAFLVKWHSILIYPIIGFYVLLTKRKVIRQLFVSVILFLLLVSPYLILQYKLGTLPLMMKSSVKIGEDIDAPKITSVYSWLFYLTSITADYFILPLGIIVLISVIYFVKVRKPYWEILLIWLLVIYLFFTIVPNKQARYIMPILVPLCIITSTFLVDIIKKYKNFSFYLAILVVILILLNLSNSSLSSNYKIPVFKTLNEPIAEEILKNPAPTLILSETDQVYPSNIMFYLTKNDKMIKTYRACLLEDSKNYNETLHVNGIKYIVYDTNDKRDFISKLEKQALIEEKADIAENVKIYSYKYYEKIDVPCNYVCIAEKWVCLNQSMT